MSGTLILVSFTRLFLEPTHPHRRSKTRPALTHELASPRLTWAGPAPLQFLFAVVRSQGKRVVGAEGRAVVTNRRCHLRGPLPRNRLAEEGSSAGADAVHVIPIREVALKRFHVTLPQPDVLFQRVQLALNAVVLAFGIAVILVARTDQSPPESGDTDRRSVL